MLLCSLFLLCESCATLFGGPISQEQRTKPVTGKRKLRPDFIVLNAVSFYGGYAFLIDFVTGAIYQPPDSAQKPVPAPFSLSEKELKIGTSVFDIVASTADLSITYRTNHWLDITGSFGHTFPTFVDFGYKKYTGIEHKMSSGSYVKLGAEVYLFNLLMPKRIANMDLFIGLSLIGNQYNKSYDRENGYWGEEGHFRDYGKNFGLGFSAGEHFRFSKRIEFSLGVEFSRYFNPQTLQIYSSGFGFDVSKNSGFNIIGHLTYRIH